MGALDGLKILEIAGIGPAPFAGMMLSDHGADVLRIDRVVDRMAQPAQPLFDATGRGRRSVAIDLKRAAGRELLLDLVERSDALLEGFRPGVMERLGLGPESCLERNPRLVYGRVTGWGQEGPLAERAGHDINYIALAGVLDPIGLAGELPNPPLNLVGDYGGGGMLLAFGVLAALHHAQRSGEGQVVDAAMIDGAALLATIFSGFRATGLWRDERGANLLDGAAPHYSTYACRDGKAIAVGALEPKFYAEFLAELGLDASELPDPLDPAGWPTLRARFAERLGTRTRDEWMTLFERTDACVSPVLSMAEAPVHEHHRARDTFVDRFGLEQPAPAPRLSVTPGRIDRPPPEPGLHTDEALSDWGISADRTASLRAASVLR